MRTMFFGRFGRLVAVVGLGLLAPIALAACGDDANDDGVAARELAARLEMARVTTDPPGAPVEDVAEPTSAPTEPTEPTGTTATIEPTVEPTGVLVPVVALDNSFRPEMIEVEVGDEVVWENRGLNEHDVLSVQDSAASFGVEAAAFQPGDIYSHVFAEAGTFHYYCSIHGNETVGMVGTVIVTG